MKHLLILLLLFTIGPQVVGQDHSVEIDRLFSEWDSVEGPGASVAVIKDGNIVFSRGYGAANIEYAIPNSPSSIFHVASVSKQFTVYAVMLLVQDGKVSWADDIREHIPEIPDFGHKITLKHLATHTSGMRDQWNLLAAAGWRMDDVITKDQVIRLLARQEELNFEPGEEYLYCNSGFTLLAEVVARVSGMTFDEFTKERMFDPLEMPSTFFYENHRRIVPNRAYSYIGENGAYEKGALNYANAGATSLFTTAEDLCTWAHHMNNPTEKPADFINEMSTPATLNNGETFGGAMGQFVNEYQGHKQIQHGGADAGYRSYLGRFPEQQLAVAVVSNYGNFNPTQKALEIASLYLDPMGDAPEGTEETQSGFVEREFVKMSKSELKEFEGTYWNEESGYSRRLYVNDEGQLMYNRGGNNESELKPVHASTLQMQDVEVDLLITFEQTADTRTMIVTIDGGEPIMSTEYTPVDHTSDELEQFTGIYYSPELDADYRLHVAKDTLTASHLRTGDVKLNGVRDDRFSGDRWYMGTVEFERDGNGNVSGFRMTSGRVRNLKFDKVE